MTNGPGHGSGRHYAADEIVAPALIELKAWYDEARGPHAMAPFDAVPALDQLPGAADLALADVQQDGRYVYIAMGEQYRRLAALAAGPDGIAVETRPVVRQHFDIAIEQQAPFHVSITRWDGPRILQYDRLILPLRDGAGAVSHLLAGEVFLRVAKPG
ncbi:MAG: hypothetical protein VW600_14580 [Ferrovibrio sp.]